MFYTGVFVFNSDAVMKLHDKDNVFDDDVLSWFDEKEKKELRLCPDGFVSNAGKIVTIYIDIDLINTGAVDEVKRTFNLNNPDDGLTVVVEELSGVFLDLQNI